MKNTNLYTKTTINLFGRIIALMLAGLLPLCVFSEDKHWSGEHGNEWKTPGNWSGVSLPIASDDVYINALPEAVVVGPNGNASAANVYVGSTGTGMLVVGGTSGATLGLSGYIYLGSSLSGNGTLVFARAGVIGARGVIGGPGITRIESAGGQFNSTMDNDDVFMGVDSVYLSGLGVESSRPALTFNTGAYSITATSNFFFSAGTSGNTTQALGKDGIGMLTLSGNSDLAGGRIMLLNGHLVITGSMGAGTGQTIVSHATDTSGTLTVRGGGRISVGTLNAGNNAGSNGSIIIESGGSYFGTGNTIIGNNGAGYLFVVAGGTFSSGRVFVGGGDSSTTGVGRVVVGNGGFLESRTGRLDIGTYVGGTLTLIDEAIVRVAGSGIQLARVAAATAALEITGTRGAIITGTNGSSAITIDTPATGGTAIVRFAHSDTNYVFANAFANGVRVEHIGTGVTKLTGNATHTGGTVISGGTLQIGNNTTSGNITGNITNNSALAVYRSNNYTLAANISGSSVLIKQGAATTTLTGNNTYTGNNIIEDGILAGELGRIIGNVATTSTSAFLQLNVAGNGVFGQAISGAGGFVKAGAGHLELTGANTYTGNTTVSEGTLKGKIGVGVLNVASGATFTFADGITNATLANITGAGTVDLNNASLVFSVAGGTQTYAFTGALTNGQNLRKSGSGVLDLGAHSIATAFAGASLVEEGTLKFDNASQLPGSIMLGSAGAVGLIDQTSGPWTQPLTITGQGGGLSVSSGMQTFSNTVNGTGDFAKGGEGSLDVRGATMNQTGGTRVLGGTLMGDAASIKGNINLANDATVEFVQNTNATVAGVISGSGNLVMNGAAELSLTGNNTYIGDTTVNSGTVKGGIGIGLLTVEAGAAYKIGDGVTNATLTNIAGLGAVDLNQASLTLTVTKGITETFAFAGALLGGGATSRLVKTGGGTLELQRAVTLGGGVAVMDGTLKLADFSLINGPVTLGGAMTFGLVEYTGAPVWTHAITLQGAGGGFTVASGTQTLTAAASISGTGDFHKAGAGTLDITAASMANTGNTRVLEGRLVGNTATIKGGADIAAGATLQFDQASTGTFAGAITGVGALHKTGAGEIVLTSTLNSYGNTLIDAGMLTGRIGAGLLTVNASGTYKVAGGVTEFELEGIAGAGTVDLNAANLTFNVASGSSQFSFTGELAGGNQFVKIGEGTLELLSAVALAQGASIKDGIVRLADQSFLNAPVVLGAVGTRGLVEYTNTASAWNRALTLTGMGGGFSVDAGTTITLAPGAAISGAGDFYKAGAGTLDITAATMSNTGNTRVLAGVLLGSAATIKGNASVAAGAAVEFFETGNAAYTGLVSGDGALAKSGAGVLTLTSANTYTGGNVVKGGELAGSAASLPGDVVVDRGARVTIIETADATYAGNVSGGGVFAMKGAGMLALTGTHSHTGGSIFESGTVVGNVDNLQGNITNNATISYMQSSGTGTFAGSMSGSGVFLKNGAGELVIDAPLNLAAVANVAGTMRLLRDVTAGTFANRSVLRIGNQVGGTRTHVTITGNYEGAPGSVVWLGLGVNGAAVTADSLTITGAASGATEIRFDYQDALPAAHALPANIVVVQGSSTPGSFFQDKNNGVRLDDGGYVVWVQNPDASTGGRWFNAIAPEVSALGGMDAAAIFAGKGAFETLERRLTLARAEKPRRGSTVWMNGLRRRDEMRGRLYDGVMSDTNGVQAGGERTFAAAGGMIAAGVFSDFVQVDMKLTNNASIAKATSVGLGGYGMYQNGPWHGSVMMRASKEDYSVDVQGSGSIDSDGSSVGCAIAFGYDVPLETGWIAGPHGQFLYHRHSIDGTNDPFGRAMRITSADTAEVRAGLRFWREVVWSNDKIIRPYARVSYLYDFKGRGRIEVFGTTFENYMGGGNGMIDAGVDMQVAHGFTINFAAEYRMGGRVDSYGGNLGVSYSW